MFAGYVFLNMVFEVKVLEGSGDRPEEFPVSISRAQVLCKQYLIVLPRGGKCGASFVVERFVSKEQLGELIVNDGKVSCS